MSSYKEEQQHKKFKELHTNLSKRGFGECVIEFLAHVLWFKDFPSTVLDLQRVQKRLRSWYHTDKNNHWNIEMMFKLIDTSSDTLIDYISDEVVDFLPYSKDNFYR